MKTKESDIGRMRRTYASNCKHVRAVLGWSENEYINAWLDMGREYLNVHYPLGEAGFAEYHRKLAGDRLYWQWWLAEWKRREDYCVRVYARGGRELTEDGYRRLMSCLLLRPQTLDLRP